MAMTNQERKANQRARSGGSIPSDREGKWRKRGIDMTWERYQEMLQTQNNQCAICGCHINGNSHVDHDHTTGEVRGLLCKPCNMALGVLEPHLNHALAYLQLYK